MCPCCGQLHYDQPQARLPVAGVSSVPYSPTSRLHGSIDYGATTQLSLQVPEPAWSSGGWSFAPINLSGISPQYLQQPRNKTMGTELSTNVTLKTPAVRAQLECSPYDFTNDTTLWLTKWDLTNSSVWNTSANPADLKVGYELGVYRENSLPPS